MENNNWSKTILGVYRYLPRVSYAFDRLVKTRAYNSGYCTSYNTSFNNVLNVTSTILDLTERKITLINLKLLTEKALKSMDNKLARMLISKFIDGKKSTEIAEKFKICLRTYFRKINLALESFYKALCRMGYNDEELYHMLKNEKWIMEVYYGYEKQIECQTENILDNLEFRNKFKQNIMFEFKKVSSF